MSNFKPCPKICEGCVVSIPSKCFGGTCKLKPVYNGKYCPCIDCLVKPICTATVMDCSVFAEFDELQDRQT